MSEEICEKLRDEMKQLRRLKIEYEKMFEEGKRSGDFSECGRFRNKINSFLNSPDSEIGILRIMEKLSGLKLKEQYDLQVKVAWESGMFKGPRNRSKLKGEEDVVVPAINRKGKKYPMPTWREVQKIICENKDIIKEKSAQGFTKMLVVPFGYNIRTMAKKFKEKVRELDQEGKNPDQSSNPDKGIFSADGEKIEIHMDVEQYPVRIGEDWMETKLYYYPKKFAYLEHLEGDEGGMTKKEIIKINGAWQICFMEDMSWVPLNGKVIGGRKQIDRMGNCIEDMGGEPTISDFREALYNVDGEEGKIAMKDPDKYRYEKGLIPEQYMWMQLTSLLSSDDEHVLMDFKKNTAGFTYLIECFTKKWHDVAFINWYGGGRQHELMHFGVGNFYAENADYAGIRTAVNLK